MSELIFLSDKTERAFSAVFLLLYAATWTQKRVTAEVLATVPEVPELVEGVLVVVFVVDFVAAVLAVAFFVVVAGLALATAVSVFLTAVAFSVSSASFAFPV